jgi:hypothetical protein
MVSILTTMILMIVISLIVLGFAQLSRRNQREALDRRLSTQAFYAAESGVNDVTNIIKNAVASGSTIPEKNDCSGTGPGGFYAGLNPDLDAAANVRYSCLMVDPTPTSLRYGDVGTTSIVAPIISANGGNISRIELDWQAKVTGNPLTGCYTTTNRIFSPTSSWNCGYGLLRFDLVPTSGNVNAAGLQADTMTSFVVPMTSNGDSNGQITFQRTSANAQVVAGVNCTTTGCRLAIVGLNQNSYHMRISSQYRDVALQIRALNSSDNAIELQNAQAVIDATGRAQDVLRRIQVHVPLRSDSQNQLSDFAIQTTDSICKRFSIMDNFFDSDVNGVISTNRLCQP